MLLSWAEYSISLRKHQILDLQTPNIFCYLPHMSIVFFQLKMARLSYANISLARLYKILTFKSHKVQGFESTSGIMCTCHEITRERVLLGSETDCQSIFSLIFELLKTAFV